MSGPIYSSTRCWLQRVLTACWIVPRCSSSAAPVSAPKAAIAYWRRWRRPKSNLNIPRFLFCISPLRWYIVAEYLWSIVAEYPWYIYVRLLTCNAYVREFVLATSCRAYSWLAFSQNQTAPNSCHNCHIYHQILIYILLIYPGGRVIKSSYRRRLVRYWKPSGSGQA